MKRQSLRVIRVIHSKSSLGRTSSTPDASVHAPRAIHRRARVTRRAHAAPRASVVVPRARIGIDVIGIHLASSPRPRARVDDVRALA